jgi:hypothetical protein
MTCACRIAPAVRRAGRFAEDVLRTTNELESVVTIIVANDKQMPRRDPLRPYMTVSSSSSLPAAGLLVCLFAC